MAIIRLEELKSELFYWLHPRWLENRRDTEKDIHEMASVFSHWHGKQSIHTDAPIGDHVLTGLSKNRHPEKYSATDARFEILAFLIPLLDRTSAHALNYRFSSEIFETVLTPNECHNFRELVWEQLCETEKNLLRARVLTDEAITLATDQTFSEARHKFWELTAEALKITHAGALTEAYAGAATTSDAINIEEIVVELFNGDKELFSTIYPTANYGYYEWMSTYIELKIELLYWVRRRGDADSIAHDLCFCSTDEITQPIGNYVYECLTDPHRGYKTRNQYGDAKFETLPLLIPKLDEIPLKDLGNRFSEELYDAFLTETELKNLKTQVWERLTESQRVFFRKRIQSPDGSHIASDPDFLDIARDPFWKLTASALRATHEKFLNKIVEKRKYDPDVISRFFVGTEQFATAGARPHRKNGTYTQKGYRRWLLSSISSDSLQKTQRERALTQSEIDAGGLDRILPNPSYSEGRGPLLRLISDEYDEVMHLAIDALVKLLMGDSADYNKKGMTKLRNAWKKAPQLVFILIGRILQKPALDSNLWTGEQHNAAYIKDIDALKKRSLDRLKRGLQDLDDDAGDITYISIYELLHRGITTKRHDTESRAIGAERSWENQIIEVITDGLLKPEHIETLQELLTPEDQDELITETEIRKRLKSTKMKKDIRSYIKDVW